MVVVRVGEDVDTAFLPERVDPGQARLHDPQRAQGRRRCRAGLHRDSRHAWKPQLDPLVPLRRDAGDWTAPLAVGVSVRV